ncbi:MAG: nitrous oxide reductase family maturation protein NosD [Planctomycetes bacterium]|jgi:nitrous oxidase accessory protein|nr:nitrous oxide reductase family maturation protein NosD [Planctomycetota bacterium]
MRSLTMLLSTCLSACSAGNEPPAPRVSEVAAPHAGRTVHVGEDVQAVIDVAPVGAVLLLAPGEHRGPLTIGKPLTLWGPPLATVRGGAGSTVRVTGSGVRLAGFTIAGSGQRFDLMDGGVHLQGSDHVLEGVTVCETLFGILVERCVRAKVVHCTVIGTGLPAMGLRGDGIRLWETNDSLVTDNHVTDSRDVVVWYSSRNLLARNRVTRSRYGTHFMYSHENVVEDSEYVACEVGVFAMYSRDIVLRRNLLAESGGAAGIGIGLKEAGNLTIEDNWLLANTTGIYIDASPLDPGHHNHYRRNVVRFAESAISLHSGLRRSDFVDNQFRDNGVVVKVGGQGDALACKFRGNFYDSYRGYDLDGDGFGDVPFEFRRLSVQLEGRYPELALLHGSPAMGMVDLVGEVMPLFVPRQLLRDEAPRLAPMAVGWTPEVRRAR